MGYNLLINGVYWGYKLYNLFTNLLLTSWDILCMDSRTWILDSANFDEINVATLQGRSPYSHGTNKTNKLEPFPPRESGIC